MLLFSSENLKYIVISQFTCFCALQAPQCTVWATTALTSVPVRAVLGLAISPLWSVSAQCQALRWVMGA